MEKNIKNINLDIVQKNIEGEIIFEMKEPKSVNNRINTEIKRRISSYSKGSIIVYPDNKFIELQKIFVEDTHLIV